MVEDGNNTELSFGACYATLNRELTLDASLFFYFGSQAVDNEQWLPYLGMVAGILAYTFLLILGIRSAYRGPQLWKVMSRTSSIFMIINVLVGISTLGFIY